MKYVQINAYSGAWAESIVFGKHRELQEQGHDSYVFWARGNHEQDAFVRKIASFSEVCLDALLTRIDGKAGFHSKRITARLLRKLDEIDPDVVHLHLLLGYYINVEMLFGWLASHRCKVVWTLHDCWAFTGHCIHFTFVNCMQWKTRCECDYPCPQTGEYPQTWNRHTVAWNYEQKKRIFTQLPPERMSLVTPSYWLADLVKESFLSKYDVEVRRNHLDTDIFKPTPSNFRERYGLEGKFVILGVASKWTERKGLSDFIRLAEELDDSYAIVLVGLSKKQIEQMPGKVVGIERTEKADELAAAYTSADVHLQPSIEETFGMTVVESLACGTPVVVRKGSACEEAASRASGDNVRVFSDFDDLKATIMQMQGCAYGLL